MNKENKTENSRLQPFLYETLKDSSEKNRQIFENTVVLLINHCMGNSVRFACNCNDYFYKTIFIGVPYSSYVLPEQEYPSYCGAYTENREVVLYKDGKPLNRSFTDIIESVRYLIGRAVEDYIFDDLKKGKQLLILEDGGYHYPVMFNFLEEHPEFADQIAGAVEQTTSGTKRALDFQKTYGCKYPFATVTRSSFKMQTEPIFIGHRVMECTSLFMNAMNSFVDYHTVFVIGYGVFGRQVAINFSGRNDRIIILEKDERIRKTAEYEGFETTDRITAKDLEKESIIIGMTGVSAFSRDTVAEFFKSKSSNLYLSSGSSQQAEFEDFIRLTETMKASGEAWNGGILTEIEPHRFGTKYHFDVNGTEKLIVLIANGLPVNFFQEDSTSLTDNVVEFLFTEKLMIGLYFALHKDIEKKMWILGNRSTRGWIDEEALYSSWTKHYQLTMPPHAEKFNIHPDTEYLREKMLVD